MRKKCKNFKLYVSYHETFRMQCYLTCIRWWSHQTHWANLCYNARVNKACAVRSQNHFYNKPPSTKKPLQTKYVDQWSNIIHFRYHDNSSTDISSTTLRLQTFRLQIFRLLWLSLLK